MKYGNLNLLEPSGPLQASNGTALPLPLPFLYINIHVILKQNSVGFQAVSFAVRTRHTKPICAQNAEVLNIKPVGTDSNCNWLH
jgi:hypothetical protein